MNLSRSCDAAVIVCSLFLLLLTDVNQVGCTFKPAILIEPEDITVGTASFSIFCIKSQNSSVAWYHNGVLVNSRRHPHLQVTSHGSLHITNATRLRDEGSYHCLVSSNGKAVISQTATVKFAYLNPFSEGDWVIDKDQGVHAVIDCKAPDSFPRHTIEWSKKTSTGKIQPLHSSHYAVSQEGNLHFAYLRKSDAGQYICTVKNAFLARQIVRTVTLQVLPAETLTSKPPKVSRKFGTPKTALKGEKFVLECIVYGMPVPRITLRKKGLHTTLGQTTGNVNRLVIDSFSKDDAGKYKCKASGLPPLSLTDTRSTIITMEARPEWITEPQDTTAGLDSAVTLPCVAYGIPAVQYTWYFNGNPLIWTHRHNFTQGNLTIQELGHHDSGMYQCFVSNKHGQLHSNIELTVSEIPAGFGPGSRFLKSNKSALMYTNVLLVCNPTGTPKPVVHWQFGSRYLNSTGRYRVLTNGNLRIRNVTKADSGTYTCEVSNRLSKATRNGYLNVVDYVVTDIPSAETLVALGQDVKFTCGVTTITDIEITIQWFKYYAPIASSKRVRVWRTRTRDTGAYTSDQKGHLKITGAGYLDAGLYTCKAEGNSKIITSNAVLTVQGPPDPPTSVNIQQQTSRSELVNVTWILGQPNHSKITKLIIQCTTQFTRRTWKTIGEESDPTRGWYQVAMSPWVQYTFRAIAFNSIGNSTPSIPSPAIWAPPAVPSKYPLNIQGEGTSPFTLKITWQPLPRIDHNGPGFYYIVYHQRTDGVGTLQRNEVHNSSSFLVTGADYFVKYTIKLQAANNVGFGPESPAVFAFSGEKMPVGTPKDLDIRITSATLAYATWTGIPINRESTRGELLGYKVYFWKAPSGQTRHNAEFKATIDTTTTLHLQPYTSYRFQVVAYNSAGDGPSSNVVGPLTTPETKILGTTTNPTGLCTEAQGQGVDCPQALPGAPRAISLSVQNKSYVELHWSPPEKTNGIIIDYLVTVQKLPAVKKPTTGRTHSSTTEMGVHNLNAMATYKISVLAQNRVGSGPPVVVIFDLPSAPQRSPSNLTVVFDKFQMEAELTWESSMIGIEGFRIFYWSPGEAVKTLDVDKDTRERTLTDLEQEEVYYFQLAAFKTVYGGHYILGPRTKRAVVGEVTKQARKTKSSGCGLDIPRVLILSALLVWLQVR